MTESDDRRVPFLRPARPLGVALGALLLFAGPAAAAEGDDAQSQSGSDGMSVEEAWNNAREDWRALQDATGEAASDARRQFEESWQQLQDALSGSDEAVPPPDPSAPEDDGS